MVTPELVAVHTCIKDATEKTPTNMFWPAFIANPRRRERALQGKIFKQPVTNAVAGPS